MMLNSLPAKQLRATARPKAHRTSGSAKRGSPDLCGVTRPSHFCRSCRAQLVYRRMEHRDHHHPLPDELVSLVLSQYAAIGFKPPSKQFTILAAFVLSTTSGQRKVISIGTGSKCLPAMRLQVGGDLVHDCHAEVLARRGAVRFFVEEVGRCVGRDDSEGSLWITRKGCGKFVVRDEVRLHLYVSTLPCELVSFHRWLWLV